MTSWASDDEDGSGGGGLLILDVPGDHTLVEVPGPSTSKNILLRLLPSPDGELNQRIKLPYPTGSGQRVSAAVGVNMGDATGNEYPGETVYYLAPEVTPGESAWLDMSFLSTMSFPAAVDTTFDITFDGVGSSPSPTTVSVALSDTYADGTALVVDMFGQVNAAVTAHGAAFSAVPGQGGAIGFYMTEGGVASITVASIVGSDDFASGLSASTAHPGTAGSVSEDYTIETCVLEMDQAGLGVVDGSGTHTSPFNLSPHMKGWSVVDIAEGVWSVERWAPRLGLLPGGWVETDFGPLGKGAEQGNLQGLLDNVRAFLIPAQTQRTLIRASRSQVVNSYERDSFLLFSTDFDNASITYTLASPDAPQPDSGQPGLDLGCRGYELSFWRHPSDNPTNAVTIAEDGGPFSRTIEPGQELVVRSVLTGYVDPDLDPGTDPGELDDPVNQVWGWAVVSGGAISLDGIGGIDGDYLKHDETGWTAGNFTADVLSFKASFHQEVERTTYNTHVEPFVDSGTLTLDADAHRVWHVTMADDTEFSFDFFGTPGAGEYSDIVLVLDGAFTPTFPGVIWDGGASPGYTAVSVYDFWSHDGGLTVFGSQRGSDFS